MTHAEVLENNCDVPGYADPLFLKHGVHFIVYLLGCMWILLGLRVVSERYFARSIEGLIFTYKIPPSIAGATLMAAGTSAPELISSLVGVFLSAKVETGAGTVIGSIVFNQLMIVGLCILVSPGSKLSASPVDMSRDLVSYAIAIALFIAFFQDGEVTLAEAWGFVAAYIAYVIICGFWSSILASILNMLGIKRDVETADMQTTSTPQHAGTQVATCSVELSTAPVPPTTVSYPQPGAAANTAATTSAPLAGANAPKLAPTSVSVEITTGTATPRPSGDSARMWGSSSGFGGSFMRVSLDMQRRGGSLDNQRVARRAQQVRGGNGASRRQLGAIDSGVELPDSSQDLAKPSHEQQQDLESGAVPDAVQHANEEHDAGHEGHEEPALNPIEEYELAFSGGVFSKIFFCLEAFWVVLVWSTNGFFRTRDWHVFSFLVCLLWFTIHCIYLIFWLEKAGCVIGISPGVMGVVFGAAGTSIPDCLCSLFVARHGMGSMALTNVWGSNVFDLLFALGVPWVVSLHIKGGVIEVQGSDALSVWMGALLLLFLVVAASCKFNFNKWHGRLFVGLYMCFIAYNFLNDSFHWVQ
eukprot:CAMPEP_0117007782 /NCGR_PEP_ID=MMETSP0472-20121206/7539_1 /TAXON_ID=693140 ORGANISM="Tiarina fusus, Strain LIS" /NCGR_SAMPLE_ID=MMETSP0472 /ASSEMBLY_ACC=CAM_ASM_000603 /LENGTH=583 /DNA_ID=CAMNT_0004709649 /DNA_START=143 /DNA_END=1895 /DNA_ORIENTATION=-